MLLLSFVTHGLGAAWRLQVITDFGTATVAATRSQRDVAADRPVPAHAVETESGRGNFLGRQLAAQARSTLSERLTGLFVRALLSNVLPVLVVTVDDAR